MIVRETEAQRALAARFEALSAAVRRDGTPSLVQRRLHLAAVERLVRRNAAQIARAIDADFGHRSTHETRLIEIFPTLEAARHARRRLHRWMRPQQKHVAPYFFGARARVLWQPLGVVGVIVPWNYPLLLALGPLVAALAAGNRAMIKMSELTPHTASTLQRLVQAEFQTDHVQIEIGDAQFGKAFAALPFDHLVFTGSTATGRSVMRAAAQNLTPVTLELGGKSPAIVGLDAPIVTAVNRIMSGKCHNAGQTCIAPDYVLVPERSVDAFVAAARTIVTARYPQLATNHDYTSIVSDVHFERLRDLLRDATARGATVIPLAPDLPDGGGTTRILPPTIVVDVDDGMRIMHEEIFGPLLPLVTYRTLDEAIAYVNARPQPLALYYFGKRRRDIDTVLTLTRSGGTCVNDVMLQFAQNELPFGGVGPSGMGAYHGRDGFETLSHKKAVFRQAGRAGYGLLEPPYAARFEALLRLLQR